MFTPQIYKLNWLKSIKGPCIYRLWWYQHVGVSKSDTLKIVTESRKEHQFATWIGWRHKQLNDILSLSWPLLLLECSGSSNPPLPKNSENFGFSTTTYAHRFIINSQIRLFIFDGWVGGDVWKALFCFSTTVYIPIFLQNSQNKKEVGKTAAKPRKEHQFRKEGDKECLYPIKL